MLFIVKGKTPDHHERSLRIEAESAPQAEAIGWARGIFVTEVITMEEQTRRRTARFTRIFKGAWNWIAPRTLILFGRPVNSAQAAAFVVGGLATCKGASIFVRSISVLIRIAEKTEVARTRSSYLSPLGEGRGRGVTEQKCHPKGAVRQRQTRSNAVAIKCFARKRLPVPPSRRCPHSAYSPHAPSSPTRQALPLNNPSPPPISMPYSFSSRFRIVTSSTPAGMRTAFSIGR